MSTAGDWSRDPLGDAERRRARGAVPWGRAEEAGEEWPPLRAAPPETTPDPQDDVETTSYISSLRDRQSPDGEWYRASPEARAARRREANPADDYGNAVGNDPGPATPPPAPVSGYRGASDTSGWLPPALPPTTYRKVAARDDDSTYSTGAHRQVDYDIDGRPMGYRALPSAREDPPRDLSLDDGTRDDGSYGATTYGGTPHTGTPYGSTPYTGTTYGGGDYTPDGRPTAYRALPSGSGDGGYGTYSAGTPFGGGTTYGAGTTYGSGATYGGYQDQAYQQEARQQPAYEQPAYEQPYEPATYEQPAYDPPRQPAYEQPAYEQPAYEQPYEQPAYEQPAYERGYDEPAAYDDRGYGRYDTRFATTEYGDEPSTAYQRLGQDDYAEPAYDPDRYDPDRYGGGEYDDYGAYDDRPTTIFRSALNAPAYEQEDTGYDTRTRGRVYGSSGRHRADLDEEERPTRRGATKARRQVPLWQELPLLVIIAFSLALVIKTFLLQAFFIPSGSMENTLKVEDRVLVNKVVYEFREPQRGEVIVFRGTDSWAPETELQPPQGFLANTGRTLGSLVGLGQPGEKDFIKRVIGVPGDVVQCCDPQGRVLVNGKAMEEDGYVFDNNPVDQRAFGPITVPEGRLFMMGDHRGNSQDSRAYIGDEFKGTVPIDEVIGRAFVKVWPVTRWDDLPVPGSFNGVPTARAIGPPGPLDRPVPAPVETPLVGALLLPLFWRRRRRRSVRTNT